MYRRPRKGSLRVWLVGAAVVALAACAPEDGRELEDTGPGQMAAEGVELGPADGHDLPAVDLDRVQVGDVAPDFSLKSYEGDVVTLSDFRGEKNIVLVFYRGFW